MMYKGDLNGVQYKKVRDRFNKDTYASHTIRANKALRNNK